MHRLLARFAGLAVLIPLVYFLVKGIIPWRKSAVYVAIVGLFAFQGFLGWCMVSRGLIDNPHVDHFRLTIHLLIALFCWRWRYGIHSTPSANETKDGRH